MFSTRVHTNRHGARGGQGRAAQAGAHALSLSLAPWLARALSRTRRAEGWVSARSGGAGARRGERCRAIMCACVFVWWWLW
jgi:hypothetical protein